MTENNQELPQIPAEGLFAGVMNAENDDQRGDAIGCMFKALMRGLNSPQVEGENPINNIFTGMFGAEVAAQAMREIKFRTFFEECLKTNVMREAITLTKERF